MLFFLRGVILAGVFSVVSQNEDTRSRSVKFSIRFKMPLAAFSGGTKQLSSHTRSSNSRNFNGDKIVPRNSLKASAIILLIAIQLTTILRARLDCVVKLLYRDMLLLLSRWLFLEAAFSLSRCEFWGYYQSSAVVSSCSNQLEFIEVFALHLRNPCYSCSSIASLNLRQIQLTNVGLCREPRLISFGS